MKTSTYLAAKNIPIEIVIDDGISIIKFQPKQGETFSISYKDENREKINVKCIQDGKVVDDHVIHPITGVETGD